MTIRLTYAKKMVIFNMYTSLCSTNLCSIRDVGRLLGKIYSSLIAVKMEKFHMVASKWHYQNPSICQFIYQYIF